MPQQIPICRGHAVRQSRLDVELRQSNLHLRQNKENPGRRAAMTGALRTEGLIFQNAQRAYQQTLEQKSPSSGVLLPS